MKKNMAILIAAVLISLGAGFFGGLEYQKSKRTTAFRNMAVGLQNGSGTVRTGVSRTGTSITGVRPVSGQVTNIDSTGITIKTQDGGSKIILFSGSTKFNKTTEGSVTDLKTGDNVMVIGTQGTDGTVSAESISIGTVGLQFQGGMNGNVPPTGN